MVRRLSGGNDANSIGAESINYSEHKCIRCADGQPSLFLMAMALAGSLNAIGIEEDTRGVIKRHSVLTEIAPSLRRVPLELDATNILQMQLYL